MEFDKNGRRIPQALPRVRCFRNYYWNEERLICYFVLLSLVIGYSIFMVNDAPFIAEKLTLWLPVWVSIIFLGTVGNQLLAAFTDPGIIVPEDFKTAPEALDSVNINENQNKSELLVEVQVEGGRKMLLKYCKTCRVIRPPQASHCQYCDVCVYRLDHHCLYMGNCIGQKNHGYFYFFLLFVSLLTLFGFSLSLFHILQQPWIEALGTSKWSTIVCVGCFLGFPFPFGLFCLHTYILLTEQTTRQICKTGCDKPTDPSIESAQDQLTPKQISISSFFARIFHISKLQAYFGLTSAKIQSQIV